MKVVVVVLSLTMVACGTERRPGGGVRPRGDSGPSDASVEDAAEQRDASPSDGGDRGDAGPQDAGPDAGARDTGMTDAGPRDAGTPDTGAPSIPLCMQTCSTPADCAPGGNAIQDADNYGCDNGLCRYLGCNGNAECTDVYGAGYVCIQHPGSSLPACVEACSVPADCTAASPLFDDNNYLCDSGGCRWLGCANADECRTALNNPSYVCEVQAGTSFPNCILPCSAASDCAVATSPAYDADNYACTGARCEYLGCNDSAECNASFMTGTWECR